MTRVRLLALAALLGSAGAAAADIPPGPSRPQQPANPPHAPPRARPKACGTGAGLSLAGAAVAWGLARAGLSLRRAARP